MRWVRTNRRFGSCLALAALALQLLLSFGHVHLDGVHLDGVHRASGQSVVAAGSAQTLRTAPVQQPSHDADDDYCAICASVYLSANSFLPQAPQLPAPPVAEAVEHFSYAAAILIAPRRAPFQSRAPPLV